MSLTSISSPDTMIKLGENDYILSPFGMKQWSEYCLWLQYKDYRDSLSLGFPKEKCDEIYERCRITVVNGPDSPVVSGSFRNLENIVKLVYISLKLKHKDITEDVINTYIQQENLSEILDKFYAAMGLVPENGDDEEGNAKN